MTTTSIVTLWLSEAQQKAWIGLQGADWCQEVSDYYLSVDVTGIRLHYQVLPTILPHPTGFDSVLNLTTNQVLKGRPPSVTDEFIAHLRERDVVDPTPVAQPRKIPRPPDRPEATLQEKLDRDTAAHKPPKRHVMTHSKQVLPPGITVLPDDEPTEQTRPGVMPTNPRPASLASHPGEC